MMKKWLKILLISLGSIVGLLTIVFSIVCFILFTPSQLTPLVNRFANDFLNAEVRIEKIDLAYFSIYPFVRLNIQNILILDQENPEDTLTFIPSAQAQLNFNELVFRNNLIITQLELRGGVTNVHFDENGKLNWAVFPETEQRETTTTALHSLFNAVDIQQIILNSGRINYRNEKKGQSAFVQNANLQLNGSFIENNLLSELSIHLKSIDYSDRTTSLSLGGFQTTLSGDLFHSHVNAISEVVLDSLHYNTEDMSVFFPQMTVDLVSASNFNDGKIRMQTIIEQIHFNHNDEDLLNNSTINITLFAEYLSENQKISIEKGAFYINEIPFRLDGNIEILDTGFFPNLTFNLDTTRFSQIYELLPNAVSNMILEHAQVNDGQIFCNGTILGKFANGAMPDIDVTFGLKNMNLVAHGTQIDTLNLVSDVKLRLNDLRNSTLTVREFFYSGHLGTASATAIVNGFTDNPKIETHLVTDLNLNRLYRMFMGRENAFRTRGAIHTNLSVEFALHDVLNFSREKIYRIRVDGIVEIDDLLVRNRQDTINLFADFVRLRFGSHIDDTALVQGHAFFRTSVRVDSLDFVYRNLYSGNIARLSTGFRVEVPTNDGTVNTQTARISFRGINFRMPEERIRLTAGRTSANVRIIPNPDKPTSPVGSIRANIDSLFFRQPGTATVRLGSSELNLALMPQNPVVRAGGRDRDTTLVANEIQEERRRGRYTALTDEQRRQQRIDRLVEMSSDQLIEKLLEYFTFLGDTTIDIAQLFMSEFSYEGSLVFDTFRLRIPDFPIPISVLSTEVNLNPRLLSLNNATVIMGNTDMVVSGTLENFRRALAGRGTLRGHMDLRSNRVDANQLMFAMRDDPALRDTTQRRGRGEEGGGRRSRDAEPELNRFELMDREREARRAERQAGGESRRQGGRTNIAQHTESSEDEVYTEFVLVSDSLLMAEAKEDLSELSEFEAVFEAPPEASLFMIPGILNMTLNVDIDTLLLGHGVMTNLHGEAEIRDEFLRLNEFRLTNRAGGMNIVLAYRAHSLNDATLWMDMTIEDTELQALLDLYPEIRDTLPILQSLEGLVDLNLTLSSHLDSTMSVDMNQTIASASMRGQDLVLLDDENFSRVSRMLGFRRRDQNLIDSLSVGVTVDDGVIEIFPFKLTMNRYSLAVGGTQNVDMSFNYHITVLRAPPRLFRPVSWATALMSGLNLGIDVSGTGVEGDRIRFRPTSARFRDLATPATSINMERTINVQEEFRRLLEHQLDQIVGETSEN
ncbi:MAG: AsmA family protein [Bacteroidales bacterium]|nr:AsmA family protein [Bacteroidales bacterium]